MTITEFTIHFDQPVYYPGQMVTGNVTVTLDKPKDVRGVELKIKGRAKFSWSDSESYTDSEGKSQTRTVTREGKESYLKTEIKLVGSKTELVIGVHTYPFAVMLPANSPSTFTGKYGGIAYYGRAKVDIPLAVDKKVKTFFKVENIMDLNHFPHLKTPTKRENNKTFCCFCCASGPLTMVVCIPKTGYAKTECIPITIEIDNASNVSVDSVKAYLIRKIHWKAQGDSKDEKDKMKNLTFGEVAENSSKTWSENMALDGVPFSNITNCNIITITYKLEVEADPSGAHSDLEVEIPLTIGDIPFHDGESIISPNPGQFPTTPGFPQQINPSVPGGFVPPGVAAGSGFVPPGANGFYPDVTGMPNPAANVGFNTSAPGQYPSVPGQYPAAPGQYPSAPGQYPSAPGQYTSAQGQYPSAPEGVGSVPYPSGAGGMGQAPYPSAPSGMVSAPYPTAPGETTCSPFPQVSGGGVGQYLPAQPPYAPPLTSAVGGLPGFQGGSTSFNQPASGFPQNSGSSTPYAANQGGNSVAYSSGTNVSDSAFYAPGTNSANNSEFRAPSDVNLSNSNESGLFNETPIVMPSSTFLGSAITDDNAKTPLLPSSSVPSN